jgi:hypothetical protein
VTDPFPASYSDRVRQIGVVNDKNRRLTQFFAKLLDGPDWLRRYLIDRFIVEGFTFDQLMTDDETRWRSPTIRVGCAASVAYASSTRRCSRRCRAPTRTSRP